MLDDPCQMIMRKKGAEIAIGTAEIANKKAACGQIECGSHRDTARDTARDTTTPKYRVEHRVAAWYAACAQGAI